MHTQARTFRPHVARVLAAPFLACLLVAPAMAAPAMAFQPARSIAALPCIPAGHGPGVAPSLSFGRNGGNIRPLRVDIYGDGTITYQGATPIATSYTISPEAVLGLQRLADAEGFWKLPAVITGTHVLPDIATLSISVRAGCAATVKTVQAHGGQLAGFTELYDTLSAAAGLGNGTTPVATQPSPTPGPQAITPASAGQLLQYVVGQRFVLELGAGFQWSLSFSTPGVFNRVPNVAMIRGAQGIYVATTAGQTTLTATGTPMCDAGQMCSQLARQFQVSLIVRPRM